MKSLLIWFLALGCAAASALADEVILIRLSIKAIRDPATGAVPSRVPAIDFNAVVGGMNQLMDSYGRGYRFVIVDPLTPVGGLGQDARPSPSFYFCRALSFPSQMQDDFQSDALANQGLYAWNAGAINVYVGDCDGGAVCAPTSRQVINIGDAIVDERGALLHAIGHYLGLCNTYGCDCRCCSDNGPCASGPGSDGISDTLIDFPCWIDRDIASANFNTSVFDLTVEQANRVLIAENNVMGLGQSSGADPCRRFGSQIYLTEGQLDRLGDIASTTRAAACDGRTIFVNSSAGNLGENGRSNNAFDRISEGIIAASPGDIVMIKGGNYPEQLTINEPCTLRTPRGQVARIGG